MVDDTLGLTENHLRGLAVTLGKLAQYLCEFSDWADGRAYEAPMYREINPLTEEQKQAIRSEVRELYRIVSDMEERLNLKPTHQSVPQIIWATCAVARQWIIELESRYMKRYGPVDPTAAAYLDPLVKEIESRIRRISGVVTGRNPE